MAEQWTENECAILLGLIDEYDTPHQACKAISNHNILSRSYSACIAKYYNDLSKQPDHEKRRYWSIYVKRHRKQVHEHISKPKLIATAKNTNHMSKFLEKLTRNNGEVKKERAERLEKITKSSAEAKVTELENKKLQLEDELDSQLDVTASNDINSLNKIEDWDADAFIEKRVRLKVDLKNVELNLEAARETRDELFGE